MGAIATADIGLNCSPQFYMLWKTYFKFPLPLHNMLDYSSLEAHKAKDRIGELQRQRTHRKSGAQYQLKIVVRPQNKHQIPVWFC